MGRSARTLAVFASAVCLLSGVGRASAQTARISGVTSAQFVNVRPLAQDSVSVLGVRGDGVLRQTLDGRLVRCVEGDRYCYFLRSGETTTLVPIIQDVTVSAWGFGRGLRAYARLRGRQVVGGDESIWPRGDDAFDALVAYVELDRAPVRVRAGRQWIESGLGYYNYDGASVRWRARSDLALDGYIGWSLARGLNEPRTSESFAAIEAFAPDARGLLFGLQAAYRPSSALALSALYQREIRDDRLGLYSERVAIDGRFRRDHFALTGTLEADVATNTVNDARVRATYEADPRVTVGLDGRHYEPFFELWTIWGAFAPTGFQEFGGFASWHPPQRSYDVTVDVHRRQYEDADASGTFAVYRDDGWTFGVAGSMRPREAWLLHGGYRLDIGFGASRSMLDVRVQRDVAEGTWLAASAVGFERQFELRVAEGTVFGIGVDGAMRFNARTRILGSLSTYYHRNPVDSPEVDWSQWRGSLRFEWTIGPEPGLPDPPSLTGGAR